MDETKRDDAPKSPKSSAQGSGSDTVSAANISAGTSVGSAGQSPRPQENRGHPGSQAQGSGGSNQASGAGMSRAGTSGAAMSGGGMSGGGMADTASDLRDKAGDALDQASDWARDQYEQGSRQLGQARDQSMRQFRQARGGVERFVSDNPLMVGVMGLAAGLIIGALLPRTRQEDSAFGSWADQVRDQGYRYAREATQRGREYVEQALGEGEDEEGQWRPEDEGRGNVRSSGPRYQNH